jgi:hypothetical protein
VPAATTLRAREEHALRIGYVQVEHLLGRLAVLIDRAGGGEFHAGRNHDRDVHHAVGRGGLWSEVAIAHAQGDLRAGIGAQGGRGGGAQTDGGSCRAEASVRFANSATRMAGWGKRPAGKM